MGIKQLYDDNLRKLPNEYGDVSVMYIHVKNPFPQDIREKFIWNQKKI